MTPSSTSTPVVIEYDLDLPLITGVQLATLKKRLNERNKIHNRLLKQGWTYDEISGAYTDAGGFVAADLNAATRQQNAAELLDQNVRAGMMQDYLLSKGWTRSDQVNQCQKVVSYKSGKKTYQTTISKEVWKIPSWGQDSKDVGKFYYATLEKAYAQQLKLDAA